MKKSITIFSLLLAFLLSTFNVVSAADKILLFDNFAKLDTGLILLPGTGPHAEYHFLKTL